MGPLVNPKARLPQLGGDAIAAPDVYNPRWLAAGNAGENLRNTNSELQAGAAGGRYSTVKTGSLLHSQPAKHVPSRSNCLVGLMRDSLTNDYK